MAYMVWVYHGIYGYIDIFRAYMIWAHHEIYGMSPSVLEKLLTYTTCMQMHTQASSRVLNQDASTSLPQYYSLFSFQSTSGTRDFIFTICHHQTQQKVPLPVPLARAHEYIKAIYYYSTDYQSWCSEPMLQNQMNSLWFSIHTWWKETE